MERESGIKTDEAASEYEITCRRYLSGRPRLANQRAEETLAPLFRRTVLSSSSESLPFGDVSFNEGASLTVHRSKRKTFRSISKTGRSATPLSGLVSVNRALFLLAAGSFEEAVL